MRPFRVFVVLFLFLSLVGLTWGQSSTTSSGTTTGSTSLQNPLQEPAKPTEAELNRPKPASFNVGDTGFGEDQWLGEMRLMSRYSEVHGDHTRSFRDPGVNNLGELNLFVDRPFSGARRMQALSMFRSSNDPSIDPEHNSLQKAFLRIYGPKDEYIIGDTLVNYSRLSFSQNIKGVIATWKLSGKWKLSIVSGVFTDRYGSLYKDLLGRPFMALVSGARLEHDVLKNSTVGLNFSSSDDQGGTLPAAPLGTAPMPASNRVASLDGKFKFKNLSLNGEYAYSFTDFDTRGSAGCDTACDTRLPGPGLGFQGDWGARSEGSYRHGKWSFRGSYLRYQPNFTSITARQISDLQDFSFRTGYEMFDWMSIDGTARRSNNDLKNQLPFETTMWGPEGRITFHNLSFYRRAVVEIGYRHRIVDASDKSIDRFVRMPYIEFTLPYHTTFFSIGYERRLAEDSIDSSQTSNTNRYYFSLRGMYHLWHGWRVNPTARFELERQSHRPNLSLTPSDSTLLYDSNRMSTAALFVDAPKYFVIETAYRDSSATILGPSGFNRPSYRGALTYKIRNDDNMTVILSFERANNYYFTSPNFDERVTGLTFVYKFGQRPR